MLIQEVSVETSARARLTEISHTEPCQGVPVDSWQGEICTIRLIVLVILGLVTKGRDDV